MLIKTKRALVNLVILIFLFICLLATVYFKNFHKNYSNVKNWKIYKEKYADRELEISSGMVRSHAVKPISITKKGIVEFYKIEGKNVKVIWKSNLNKSFSARQSSRWAMSNKEVYITSYQGLIALNKKSGKTLWKSNGPTRRLLAIENLIIACDGDGEYLEKDRYVVARKAANGEIAWKTEIPQEHTPNEIIFTSDLIWVKGTWGNENYTYLLTPKGKIIKKYQEYVTDLFKNEKDIIFVSNRRITKIDKNTNIIWKILADTKTLIRFDHAKIIDAKNDTILVYFYDQFGPSSVTVFKINSQNGKIIWKTDCAAIRYDGFGSKYTQVYLKIINEEVAVVNRNSRFFLETLSLKTGKKINRYEFNR